MNLDINLINRGYAKSLTNIVNNKIELEYEDFKGVEKFSGNLTFLLKMKEKLELINPDKLNYELYYDIIHKLEFILNDN